MTIERQKLPFMFETWNGGNAPEKSFLLPYSPEGYRIIHPTRANVTQTKGGGWEDNAGLGLPKIYLNGTFGYYGSLPGGGGKHLRMEEKNGWELFKEFEAEVFFSFYRQFGPGGTGKTEGIDLRFYNFSDEDFFSVQIGRFEIQRSVQRRFLYAYTMEITSLGRIDDSSTAKDSLAEYLASTPEPDVDSLRLWGRLLEGYTFVSKVISDAINLINAVSDKLAIVRAAVTGYRQGVSDFIQAPFGLLTDIRKTIDTVLDKVTSLEDLPHEFTDLLRQEKRKVLILEMQPHLFQTPVSSMAASSGAPPVAEIISGELPTGQIAADEQIVAMDSPETTIFDPSTEFVSDVSVAEEALKSGDTLESVAARVLGDSRQWQRIALLNDLEYPYVVGDDPLLAATTSLGEGYLEIPAEVGTRVLRLAGTLVLSSSGLVNAGEVLLLQNGADFQFVDVEAIDGYDPAVTYLVYPLSNSYPAGTKVSRHARRLSVLKPGDKVQIPGGRSDGPTIIGGSDVMAERLYGTDEYLDVDGATGDDGAGDVATVTGLDNLEMQLRHRLMTVRGELAHLGHTGYGSLLPLIIGELGTEVWYERARLEGKIALLQDPRIANVPRVDFSVVGTSVYVDADVIPINQSSSRRLSLLLVE